MSVEKIYQKKTQLEHILLRPDSYIGSTEPVTQSMWVYDGEGIGMVYREVTFVPGLYKIFDEILVNAADNKQRDKNMDCIRIDIDPDANKIVIYNNGRGIPVVEHKNEKMYVPSLIFGHLLTSSNYDDNEKKVTGGRNGYGAKLCNTFSNRFIVETSSKEYKNAFKQEWNNNMNVAKDPKISAATSEDFTRVTFYPDLAKFKMDKLDKDIIALFSRRAYDVAGSTKGVKVYLNGKRLPVKSFKDYVDLYLNGKEDEAGNPIKATFEEVNDRWQVAVALSDKGFQQVSFVNSIATTKGGRHVDYITDQVVSKLVEVIKKKNKAKVNIKPFQIKNHLWIFVNCLIENPSFDSQTKENMTLQVKSFGSKCQPSEKFFKAALRIGIVESIMSWVKYKAESQLNTKCSAKKHTKIAGIPKLEDANDAGSKFSTECTLILTEGDSAKSLVVAGFGVIGRDKYGVFPLRGKLLNVREATHKQIMENAEINNLIKILGLQYKKKYETIDDLKTLRYGKLMIMTDQDADGSHIKGLLVNFIHHNWPSLLRLPFLEEFITPIVKVTKGNQKISFYSIPEYEEWKKETQNWASWRAKYYKGLGTSSSDEAKEYFSDLGRHRIAFKYQGDEDDHSILLAFSKKMIDQRKDWLTFTMEDRRTRRELGLPETYLYGKMTKEVTYKDFVNKELVLFSNLDNERSIPSIMDGFKPGQRKVLFACFKKNQKSEIKVAQLAGAVGEISAYHHGEASLQATIVNLAQNFVGSNNINLLVPAGQFGTRLLGGKDAASARYIFTKLSPLARKIFPEVDDPLLNFLYDDNIKVEPEFYVPIIPMVLVNGAEGIGTGWSTKIPNFNPREIADNIKRLILGEPLKQMKPWFKGFRGSIDKIESNRYLVSGEVAELEPGKIEITELPVRVWTQTYKENVLEVMLKGTEKSPSFINDYKEYHTESTVRFVVHMSPENMYKAEEQGMHKTFKLQTTFSTTSMVLFDHNGCIRKYETPEDILREYFEVRLTYYHKRKEYLEGMLEAEAKKIENQARFILEKIEGKIRLENVRKNDIIQVLINAKYQSDPVKAWKIKNNLTDGEPIGDEYEEEISESHDFDYLLDMTMRSMLKEKVEELLKKRDEKKKELEMLQRTSVNDLWLKDLDEFLAELDKVEQQESEMSCFALKMQIKGASKSSGKGRAKSTASFDVSTKPSEFARRIPPSIDLEQYRKKEASESSKKTAKAKKITEVEEIEDEDRPLVDRIGISPEIIDSKNASLKESKKIKAKALFKSSSEQKKKDGSLKKKIKSDKKKAKKRNPWSSDSDMSDSPMELSASSEDDVDLINPTTESVTSKTTKTGNIFDSDEDDNQTFNNSSVANHTIKDLFSEDSSHLKRRHDSGSDDSLSLKAPAGEKKTSEQLFDTLFARAPTSVFDHKTENGVQNNNSEQNKTEIETEDNRASLSCLKKKEMKKPPKKTPTKEKKFSKKKSLSSDDDFYESPKKKKKSESNGKRKKSASSDEDFEATTTVIETSRVGRAKKPVSYNFGDTTDDED